ncbi:hypothetical protein A3E49_03205 [Candidatus Saccharibacteria bacterium RIFCSPHIGHO2_12_FULL_49_19]|nr:MAG: hypothetical protein A3E49_03205 [Candidatus Saccharibacteria bacterium RIFCSPHIGHO2_12_FULL_49_19]
MTKQLKLVGVSLICGALVPIIFTSFEFLVKDGTEYLWNDVFNTDQVRWGVIPLAIVLSIVFSATLKMLTQKRLIKPKLDPLEKEKSDELVTLQSMGVIFVVGVASLMAGASLGPEASLVALSTALGLWLSSKAKMTEVAQLIALSAVGALLVAFMGSLIPVLIPLLILYRQDKRLAAGQALMPILTGLAAYLTLLLIADGHGFGTIPASGPLDIADLLTAFALGALCVLVAMTLHQSIKRFYGVAKTAYSKLPWYVSGLLFGAVLGLLYFIGGETVQFNGSEGTVELLKTQAQYGTLAFLGLAAAKLLATGWSLAVGYRGGLIFPSIYTGVALSLFAHSIFGGLSENGLMIGSIAGIFSVLTGSPAMSLIMISSLVPLKMIWLVLAGIAGTVVARQSLSKIINVKM